MHVTQTCYAGSGRIPDIKTPFACSQHWTARFHLQGIVNENIDELGSCHNDRRGFECQLQKTT